MKNPDDFRTYKEYEMYEEGYWWGINVSDFPIFASREEELLFCSGYQDSKKN